MEGRCIFIVFMVFNGIFGLSGLAVLGSGIALAIVKPNTGSNVGNNAFIALIVIGVYITTILILGACSWKRQGVLIAYFVLILLLIIVEIIMIILIKVGQNATDQAIDSRSSDLVNSGVTISIIVFSVSLGIAFLSYLFSTIYFCLMRKEEEPQYYTNIRNLEYNTMPHYQNV